MLNSIFSPLGYLLLGAGVGGACLLFAVAYDLRRKAREAREAVADMLVPANCTAVNAPPAKKRSRPLGRKNKPKADKKKSVRRRS